jgi:hypothetical protein
MHAALANPDPLASSRPIFLSATRQRPELLPLIRGHFPSCFRHDSQHTYCLRIYTQEPKGTTLLRIMSSKRPLHLLCGLYAVLLFLALLPAVEAIGQTECVVFSASEKNGSLFSVVEDGSAAPILVSVDDWPGVHRALLDFQADIEAVTDVKPTVSNFTANETSSSSGGVPFIIGTLGHSSLIDEVVNSTGLDVSALENQWEAFMGQIVENPLPGIDSAYLLIGADKRGTIYGMYDLSEQFGVSPWYWWADVPTTKNKDIFIQSSGCSHGSPTIKYRGIFLNDEQPALQNWAMEKFTNGTGSVHLNSPFNSKFYAKL